MSCGATSDRRELQTQECRRLTIFWFTILSNQLLDEPVACRHGLYYYIRSTVLHDPQCLWETFISLSDPMSSSFRSWFGMLIPRHERWPVLTSTQGYCSGIWTSFTSTVHLAVLESPTDAGTWWVRKVPPLLMKEDTHRCFVTVCCEKGLLCDLMFWVWQWQKKVIITRKSPK